MIFIENIKQKRNLKMNEILIDVPENFEGERVDKFLSLLLENSSRNSMKLVRQNIP